MYANWQWALRILAGDWLGRDTYHPYFEWMKAIAPLETWYRWWGGKEIFQQAPLYPYWVAGLMALSSRSLSFVILVQLMVGALQPLVMFALARRLFDERVGLVAAALTALYGPFIFYEGVLLRDWLPPVLEPLALLALLNAWGSGRSRDWLLAGGTLGAALLTKETVLLFLLLVGVWLLWETWPPHRQIGRAGAWILVGLLLSLSPLLLRNVVVGAPVFALSNRAAQSFIAGNAIDSSPTWGKWGLSSRRGILERSDGKLPAVIQETLRMYQGDYGLFLRKQALKLRGLIDPYEAPNNESYYYGLDISPVLRFTLRYGFIFPLGIAGLLLSLPTWRGQRLLYLYMLAALGGLLFSVTLGRYRLVLVPGLTLYAAAFLVWLSHTVSDKQVLRALGGLGAVVGVALAQQLWLPLAKPEQYVRPHEYLLSAQVYASEGRLDRSVAELDRLRERAEQLPDFANLVDTAALPEGDYRAQWAKQLLEEGRRAEAQQQVKLAEAAYARRPDLSYPCYNLALLYLKLNEPAKARPFLERFLELDPQGPQAGRVRRLLVELKDAS
jgi:4-amino-4-deoxy-L-arabinose transferase-like glycosyltransferase